VVLGFDRNAADRKNPIDGVSLLFGCKLGPFRSNIGAYLDGKVPSLEGTAYFSPYPDPFGEHDFEQARFSGDLSYTWRFLTLGARAACTIRPEKEDLWEASASVSAKAKWGRLAVKVASPKLPEKWEYSISYRLQSE
jgi:hypothetical protein